MFENLNFTLSCLSPNEAERTELATLYPSVDDRWHQKMDRTRLLVTVRDAQLLVAAGMVHDSILAPTSAMDALELGSMAVRSDYRRLGIRQHVTSLRLEFALKSGGTAITIINSANPASWAHYERSELWERERSFEQDGQHKYIYRATERAWKWATHLPRASEDQIQAAAPTTSASRTNEPALVEQALEFGGAPRREVRTELGLKAQSTLPALRIGPDAEPGEPHLAGADAHAFGSAWFETSFGDPAS